MNEQIKIKNDSNETLKAGCVVVNDKREVLLVTDEARKIWSFPKGHMEPNETLEMAALREVKEETGYDVEIVRRLSDATYVNGETGELVRVAMFQAKPLGTPSVQVEPKQLSWFSIEEARKVVYKNLVSLLDEIK